MGNFKGASVLFIRKMLKEKSPEMENVFISKLSHEEQILYSKCLAFTWVPIEIGTKFYEVAASLLFPNEPNALVKIGKQQAKDDLSGIYKILVRFATIPYVIKQSAEFWKTYHETGQAKAAFVENKKECRFIVEQYPNLPERFREVIQVYIEGVIELTGGKMVTVKKAEANNNGWEWFVTWD